MLTYFILIENIKEPILIELKKDFNKGGYVVFRKKNLDKLPKAVKQKLIKNGLYKKLSSGHNGYNNLFLLHRLVLCLYINIVDFFVHHIHNHVLINNICNLVKVTQEKHDEIEALGKEAGMAEAYNEQQKMFSRSRSTLAQNAELVLNILKLRGL
jgi:hypothetical protein